MIDVIDRWVVFRYKLVDKRLSTAAIFGITLLASGNVAIFLLVETLNRTIPDPARAKSDARMRVDLAGWNCTYVLRRACKGESASPLGGAVGQQIITSDSEPWINTKLRRACAWRGCNYAPRKRTRNYAPGLRRLIGDGSEKLSDDDSWWRAGQVGAVSPRDRRYDEQWSSNCSSAATFIAVLSSLLLPIHIEIGQVISSLPAYK
jgi:hypothetical protein